MSDPLLRVSGLTAGYGRADVIRDVTLEVAPGEIVCLLGPNGAGKSTVLRAIVKTADVHGGTVAFRGRDITQLHTHELLELGIAYVPQGRINFPTLSVRQNLEMGGFLLNHAHTRRGRVAAVLQTFPTLKEKLSLPAASLSGGEGQMLAIARALVMRPTLLLLDEPSLGLGPQTAQDLFRRLAGMVAAGMSILLVEQNVRLALSLAGRGYLMAGGRITFDGSAATLADPERMRALYLGS